MSIKRKVSLVFSGTVHLSRDLGGRGPTSRSRLVLKTTALARSPLSFLGWSPLELKGSVELEGVSDHAELGEGCRLQVGPPFHRDSQLHVVFRDKNDTTWRLLGSSRLRILCPRSSASTFKGKLYESGAEVGRWELELVSLERVT
jgi:hypothetical protein